MEALTGCFQDKPLETLNNLVLLCLHNVLCSQGYCGNLAIIVGQATLLIHGSFYWVYVVYDSIGLLWCWINIRNSKNLVV